MTGPAEHLDLELTSWLDGELDAQARDRVAAHLAGCAECQARLAGLEAVVAAAKALADRRPDAELWPGIARRITPGRVLPMPRAVTARAEARFGTGGDTASDARPRRG